MRRLIGIRRRWGRGRGCVEGCRRRLGRGRRRSGGEELEGVWRKIRMRGGWRRGDMMKHHPRAQRETHGMLHIRHVGTRRTRWLRLSRRAHSQGRPGLDQYHRQGQCHGGRRTAHRRSTRTHQREALGCSKRSRINRAKYKEGDRVVAQVQELDLVAKEAPRGIESGDKPWRGVEREGLELEGKRARGRLSGSLMTELREKGGARISREMRSGGERGTARVCSISEPIVRV